jgi:uncharacterized protein
VTDKNHILQLIKESVKTADPKATLILYGSYARGDYNDESDIDLLILIDKDKVTHDDRVKISYPLYDIQFATGVLISPMVCSRQLWENKHMVTPFYENVTNEGIIL